MPTKDDDAREAWSCMLRMLVGGEHQQRLARAAEEAGLTLRQLHALFDLDPDNPRPMRDLAVEWYCDASNVTGIVDGLEAIGMVERLPSK
ncbi:MAG TPA: MarR family winged helix-turn-helix transcriptional regulator, partial [Acidimicrobiales bacterium]